MKFKTLALFSCVSMVFCSPAQAAVALDGFTLDEGTFGGGEGNVLSIEGQDVGNTVLGSVNTDDSPVTFFSLDGLAISGGGAAVISPLSGILNALEVTFAHGWDNITFSFDNFVRQSSTFDLVVNGTTLFAGGEGGNCTICTIGNGSNQFTLSGSGITNLAFNFEPGIATARQFRVRGPSNTPAPAVPEPGTWLLMILGFGAVGFALRGRQTTAVRVRFA